jgi:ClpP class serine protease
MEREGVKIDLISAGPFKTEDSRFGPLSDEARAHKQTLVDGYYEMFVDDVAQGRGTTTSTVEAAYGGGRMLLAKGALEAGMIDRIETLDTSVGRLASRGASPVAAAAPDTLVDGWTDPPPEWAGSASDWAKEPEASVRDGARERLEAELEFRQRRAAKGR